MTTISQERAALARVGRPLRTREQAGFKFNYTTSRPVDEPATRVFVHITITNPRSYSSDDAHARAVEAIGISRFPSTGVSYNRLIMQSGRAYEGQPVGRRGAHTINDKKLSACTTAGCPGKGGPLTAPSWNLNVNSRAYAICQNVGDAVPDVQLDSLARSIAADMLAGFVRKDAEIHGHRCVAYKDCPASKMWARMGELRQLVTHYVTVGFIAPKPPVTPPSTEDEMSAKDVEDGIANYMKRFFTDEQGTGDSIVDENREHAAQLLAAIKGATDEAVLAAIQENTAAVTRLAAAVEATLPKS